MAQLTGAAFVLATSQVTVSVSPTNQLRLVLGAVTRNGPAEAAVVTSIKSLSVQPEFILLSLTVNENSMFLLTEGSTSQVGLELPIMAAKLGI